MHVEVDKLSMCASDVWRTREGYAREEDTYTYDSLSSSKLEQEERAVSEDYAAKKERACARTHTQGPGRRVKPSDPGSKMIVRDDVANKNDGRETTPLRRRTREFMYTRAKVRLFCLF